MRRLFSNSVFVILCLTLLSTGCTHLFLQPSKRYFTTPDKFGIKYEEHYLKSFDGTKIAYWKFPIQNYKDNTKVPKKTRAILVQYHGNGENMSTHFQSMVWPTIEGIEVYTFDYRSYGRSEGPRDLSGAYHDGLAMLKFLSKEAKKRNLPLIVYGQSLGGSIALKNLQEYKPESLKLVIAESSFYSYQQIAREKLSENWITFLFQPLAYLLVSDEHSPGGKGLSNISPTPVILIHSKKDHIVGANHSEQLYKDLKDPKHLWLFDEPGHINALWIQKGHYKQKLIQTLNTLL